MRTHITNAPGTGGFPTAAASAQIPDVYSLPPDTFLLPAQAAAALCLSDQTLANWRNTKRGPRFFKVGGRRVVYKAGDIAAFINAGERTPGADTEVA